jgi:thiamine phosphate synthase YjbQ (UPF0047 family)
MKALKPFALFGTHSEAADAPPEDGRVVELFRARAELRKQHDELGQEVNRLRDRLKQQDGATGRVQDMLDTLVPAEGPYYRHDDLTIRTEGLEDDPHEYPNGHSHCRAALIGVAPQSIPIVDGNLLLGRYQSVFFCELDRAKPRKVFIQVMGE